MKTGRKLRDSFTIRTVRKKILMISKLAGILLILSYILSVQMEIGADLSFILWMLLVTEIVLLVDV
ncbi:MAG: sensor histidine kinase, partial [Lachnospiraceae bacterium]|nr:sensor histidine kinase [Lachnospiraceae bacterium]